MGLLCGLSLEQNASLTLQQQQVIDLENFRIDLTYTYGKLDQGKLGIVGRYEDQK